MKRARRRQEGGFALLLVFLMAAAVAFTIYQELPRAAFESARDKEQLLIDRGNQYKRAIEVFFAVNKRYPADLKDLEEFGQKRYLRHRYKDPLTGEDEWRLIHTNGSFLTDSLVQKPPQQNAANGGPGAPTVGGGPLGANSMNTAPAAPPTPAADPNNPGTPAVNAAVQRRPSDRTITAEGFPQPGNPGGAAAAGGNPQAGGLFGAGAPNYDPNDPRTWPAITLTPANPAPGQGNPAQPGQAPNAQVTAGQLIGNQSGAGALGAGAGGTGMNVPGQPPGFPNPFGQSQPVQLNPNPQGQFNQGQLTQPQSQFGQAQFNTPPSQFNPGQFNANPANPFAPASFPGAQSAAQVNPQIGAPASPQPVSAGGATVGGLTPANGGNAALQAINDQLFRPAQALTPGGPGNAMGSPGIAGVASKHEGPSIKSYRDRTKYQEWEFVFDASAKTGPQAAVPGQNPAGQAPLGQNPLGQNPAGQPGFGQPASGQQPFGQPGQPFGQPMGQPAPGPPGAFPPGQNPASPFPPGFSNPFSPQGQNQGR